MKHIKLMFANVLALGLTFLALSLPLRAQGLCADECWETCYNHYNGSYEYCLGACYSQGSGQYCGMGLSYQICCQSNGYNCPCTEY